MPSFTIYGQPTYTINGKPATLADVQAIDPGFKTPGAGAYPSAGGGGGAGFGTRPGAGGGGSPYGTRPAQVPTPPSLYQQALSQVPALGAGAATATGVAQSEMEGVLSPATIQAIEDASAAWGVGAGLPSTTPGNLAGNLGLRNLGLNVESVQNQGINNYNAILRNIGGLQNDPSMLASLGEYNSQVAAAPDPAAAAAEMERLWQKHFLQTLGYTSPSPAGGTGVYRPGIVQNPLLPPGPPGGSTAIPRDILGFPLSSTSSGMLYGGNYYEQPPGTYVGQFPSGVPGIFPDINAPLNPEMTGLDSPYFTGDIYSGD